MKTTAMASAAAASLSQPMAPLSTTAAIDLFAPAPPLTPSPALSTCQLYYQLQNHPMTSMPTPTLACELVTSAPEPPPHLLQWPPQSQSQYLPATELGGFLGSHGHTHPTAVSPGALLLPGLCTDSALEQHEIVDDMSCSKPGLGVGGQYHFNVAADPPSDAVSAVIKDDEKVRLGFLHHYGLGATAGADVSAAALPCIPPTGNAAASSASTDQLQGTMLNCSSASNLNVLLRSTFSSIIPPIIRHALLAAHIRTVRYTMIVCQSLACACIAAPALSLSRSTCRCMQSLALAELDTNGESRALATSIIEYNTAHRSID